MLQVQSWMQSARRYGRGITFAGLTAGLLLAGGCASTGGTEEVVKLSMESMLSQAENELSRGKRDNALAMLNRAAKENPTNVGPWLRIANMWFDEGNYPSAILAANEVLARDANHQEAKSIVVVAGLRVAAAAANGLVSRNSVSWNARQEAETLTNSLRTALGEKVLVPASTADAAPPARPRVKAQIAIAKPAPAATPAAPAQQAAAAPVTARSSDPFKSLK